MNPVSELVQTAMPEADLASAKKPSNTVSDRSRLVPFPTCRGDVEKLTKEYLAKEQEPERKRNDSSNSYSLETASILVAHGEALFELGEAQEAIQRVTEVKRFMAKPGRQMRGSFGPVRLRGLLVEGIALDALGKTKSAIKSYNHAYRTWSLLSERQRYDEAAVFARVRANLAIAYRERGWQRLSIGSLWSCERDLQKIVQPQEQRPDLLSALADLGNAGLILRNIEVALSSLRKCEAGYRSRVAAGESRFLADLGVALDRVAQCLTLKGDRQGSLKAYDEAEGIFRQLVGNGQKSFLAELAGVLSHRARSHISWGEWSESVDRYRLSDGIVIGLAGRGEGFLYPTREEILGNLGRALNERKRWDEAVDTLNQCEELCRKRVAQGDPNAAYWLGPCLNNLGYATKSKGDVEKCIAVYAEAEPILRKHARRTDPGSLSDLAAVSINLGEACFETGRSGEAVHGFRGGAKIYRRWLRQVPKRGWPDPTLLLDNALKGLALAYYKSGRTRMAFATLRESEKLNRRLIARGMRESRSRLAEVLSNIGVVLAGQDLCVPLDLGALEKGVFRVADFVLWDGVRFIEAFLALVRGEHVEGLILLQTKRNRLKAILKLRESAQIYRSLIAEGRFELVAELSKVLKDLSSVASMLGLEEEARAAVSENGSRPVSPQTTDK